MGSLGERDEAALQRFRRNAEAQAEKAAQALGYFQAQIDSEVKDGKPPKLTLKVVPGEPVRLRQVNIRCSARPPAWRASACRRASN